MSSAPVGDLWQEEGFGGVGSVSDELDDPDELDDEPWDADAEGEA